MKKCIICGYSNKILRHHNRYFPEEIIYLCKRCHSIIHNYNSLQLLQLTLIVEKYADNWLDTKKFYKENHNDGSRLEAELQSLDSIISEREAAIDLLKHWKESDEIQ